jgi:hypothetical protein
MTDDGKITYGLLDLLMYRYCQKCKQIKPPRAHHCSVCGKCVLKMDHHCPWVGGCVAYNNHKYFLQFLVYTTFGCAYSALTMGICSISIFEQERAIRNMTWTDKNNMVLASVLSVSLSIAIGILLLTHLYMIWTNQGSVESGILMSYNPFFDSHDGLYYQNLQGNCANRTFNFSRNNFY